MHHYDMPSRICVVCVSHKQPDELLPTCTCTYIRQGNLPVSKIEFSSNTAVNIKRLIYHLYWHGQLNLRLLPSELTSTSFTAKLGVCIVIVIVILFQSIECIYLSITQANSFHQ